jgi:FixJ family two-component response regulator
MSQKILIVDDEEEQCNWFKKRLEKEFKDVKVFACYGEKEAIQILEREDINVVVTDMWMETERNGYKLLRFAKTQNPRTQVVIYTGHPNVQTGVDCIRAGGADYIEIEKDPDFDKLYNAISIALKASESKQDADSLNEKLIISAWKELMKKQNSEDKGKILEELCYLLFRSIPGWEKINRNVRSSTEEFDLVIINESKDEIWKKYGTMIFVECKNWSKNKPGKNELGTLLNKIRDRNPRDCNLGFFISVNGFTKTFHKELDKISQADIRIITVSIDDLEVLIFPEDRNGFLKDQLYKQLLS